MRRKADFIRGLKLCAFMLVPLGLMHSCATGDMSNVEQLSLLVSDSMNIDTIPYSYPLIKVSGRYCCIADADTKDNYFQIYSYPEMKHLKSCIRKGKAKNEIPVLMSFDFTGNNIIALSTASETILDYNIVTDSTQAIKYPKGLSLIRVAKYGDMYYTYSVLGDMRVVALDDKGKIVSRLFPTPKVEKLFGNFNANEIWQSLIVANKKTIALLTTGGDVVELYDIASKQYNKVVGPYGEPTLKELSMNGNPAYGVMFSGYRYAQFGNKTGNLYAFFRGESHLRNKEKDIENHLRVFNTNGELIKEYILDKNLYPNSFVVDEDKKCVIFVLPDNKNQFWKFNL